MSTEKFPAYRQPSSPQTRPSHRGWGGKASGGTHYFKDASGFTIAGGEFNAVGGDINHYNNDLRGSTNYSGYSVNNHREFGTGATFNGGDFTHTNGDANYYARTGSKFNSNKSNYNERNYGLAANVDEDEWNTIRDDQRLYRRGDYQKRTGLARPSVHSDGFVPIQDRYLSSYEDYRPHSEPLAYNFRNEWNPGPDNREKYEPEDRLNYSPRTRTERTLTRPDSREDYGPAYEGRLSSNSPANSNQSLTQLEGEYSEDELVTDILIQCLSLDHHFTESQKKSNTEFVEALEHYFQTRRIVQYRRLVYVRKQYQNSHQNVGGSELRAEIFRNLEDYILSEEEDRGELLRGLIGLASQYQNEMQRNEKPDGESNDEGSKNTRKDCPNPRS